MTRTTFESDAKRTAKQIETQVSRADEAATPVESVGEVCSEICDVVTKYIRHKPHVAAYSCVALGFVLGWKLRPW